MPRRPRPWPAKLDRAKVQAAVDLAFADPAGLTAAMVVVHKGQIVGERYMAGITKDTQLESWSMGKSLTATLVGLVVKDGAFALDDPAPVPDWRRPGDPRGPIRVRDVMQMSSGLSFTGQDDRWMDPTWQYHDHFFIYAGAVDAFKYAITSPVEFAPGTVGRYRNSDPMTLGFLVRQAVEKKGEAYLTWPQRALFDRIGIRRQVLEPDPWGNFLLSGYDYGTARNWARLGLLYLQDGMWNGQRLLPEGWATFVRHPGAGVAAEGVRRPVLGERRRAVEPAARRLLHVGRRRAAHLHRALARPGGGADGPPARGAGGHEAVEPVARRPGGGHRRARADAARAFS